MVFHKKRKSGLGKQLTRESLTWIKNNARYIKQETGINVLKKDGNLNMKNVERLKNIITQSKVKAPKVNVKKTKLGLKPPNKKLIGKPKKGKGRC